MDVDVPEEQPYMLREELHGHGAAVRSLCVSSTGDLVSGGADALVQRWELGAAGAASTQGAPIMEHGDKSVLACCPLLRGVLDDAPTGGFVTGCADHCVRVFNSEGTMVRLLQGHSHGVISLSYTSPADGSVPLLISGSWDGSAKFWQLNGEASCVATLPDHENGVSVLGLPNGDVATGSTGKQQDGGIAGCCVRLWRHTGDAASSSSGGWSCVATHEDHAGPVRSLCLASASTAAGSGSDGGSDGGSIYAFASTSNDGTITVRSPGGDPLHTVVHPSSGRGENFVYGAAPLVSAKQGFVSISEDCSAAVWSVPQAPSSSSSGSSGGCEVVEHPDGVWCCCALPEEGDFATGCNDGIVRLWTRDPARAASPAAREAAAEAVAAAKASRQGGPSPEEVAKLPQWANRLATPGRGEGDVKVFNKNGVAVAAQWAAASSDWIEVGEVTGSRDSGMVDGVKYDHVLAIEIEQPTGLQKLQIGHNDGDNPYTTAYQFIAKHGLNPDDLEKIANFITQNAGAGGPTLGSGGSSAAASASSSSSSSSVTKPKPPEPVAYVRFDKPLAVDKIEAKINEFSAALEPEGMSLSPADARALGAVCSALANTSRWHATSIAANDLAALLHVANKWPPSQVWAVLDLLRIACLHPEANAHLASTQSFLLLESVLPRALTAVQAPDAPMPLQVTTLRLASNLFFAASTRSQVVSTSARATSLIDAAAALAANATAHKNVRTSAAALAVNYGTWLSDPTNTTSSASSGAVPPSLFAGAAATLALATGAEDPLHAEVAYGFMLAAKLALAATGDVSAARASPLPAALQAAEAAPMSAQAAEVATTLRSMVY